MKKIHAFWSPIFYFLLFFPLVLSAQSFSFEDLQYPFPVKKIQVRENIEIAYVEEGKGETTLFFIHGLGSYLPAWKKNIEVLRQNYHCVALDLPGYGKSGKNTDPISLAFYADIISEMIQKLKLKQVVLVGHSMGGQIAMGTALKYPQVIQKLILIAPAGLEQFSESEAQILKNYTRPETIQTSSDAQIRQNLNLNFFQMPKDALFMAEDRIRMKTAPDFPAYCKAVSQCVAAMLAESVYDRLKTLNQKTLLIFGENDALIPNKFLHPQLSIPQIAEHGKNQIPNTQVLLIPEAGHFVHFEQYQVCNEAILKFLKSA